MTSQNRPPFTQRFERMLTKHCGRGAPLVMLAFIAAVLGDTSFALSLRVRSQSRGYALDLLKRAEQLLPKRWVHFVIPPAEPDESSRLMVTGGWLKQSAAGLSRRTRRKSYIDCIGAADADGIEGFLDLQFDEGEEQMRWLAEHEASHFTARGNRRERHFAELAEFIRPLVQRIQAQPKVEFATATTLPALPITPAHLPFLLSVAQNVAIGMAVLDYAVDPDGVIRPPSDIVHRATSLLVRAGAVDPRPHVRSDDLDLFEWFRLATPAAETLQVKQLWGRLIDPAFIDQLEQLVAAGIRVPRMRRNEPMPLHQVRRSIKRLAEVGMVEVVEPKTKPQEWWIPPQFREYRPTQLVTALVEATKLQNRKAV
jgi:hypothetical protein